MAVAVCELRVGACTAIRLMWAVLDPSAHRVCLTSKSADASSSVKPPRPAINLLNTIFLLQPWLCRRAARASCWAPRSSGRLLTDCLGRRTWTSEWCCKGGPFKGAAEWDRKVQTCLPNVCTWQAAAAHGGQRLGPCVAPFSYLESSTPAWGNLPLSGPTQIDCKSTCLCLQACPGPAGEPPPAGLLAGGQQPQQTLHVVGALPQAGRCSRGG